jgi:hypothetical protein
MVYLDLINVPTIQFFWDVTFCRTLIISHSSSQTSARRQLFDTADKDTTSLRSAG